MHVKSVAFAAAALALAVGSAQAGVTYLQYDTTLPTGQTLVTNFSGLAAGPVGATPVGLAMGDTLVGGTILAGTTGDGAAPWFGGSGADPGQYLSVLGGDMATVTIGATNIHDVSFYAGSLDLYNEVTFNFVGGGSQTFMGSDLGNVSGAAVTGDYGSQTGADTNGRFMFSFGQAVSSFTFSSTENSFEIADIGAAVPEPGTWAFMIAGAALMGAGLRQARRQGATARAA